MTDTDTIQPPASDRATTLISILACVVAVALFCLSTYFILKSRTAYLTESRLKSQTQAQLLGENTASIIYATDVSLMSAKAVAKSTIPDHHGSVISVIDAIRKEIRLMPQVKNLILVDAKGEILYASNGNKSRIPESFREHRDAWLDFTISTRLTAQKKAVILMSRRLEDSRGEFIGVLAAEIDTNFFYDRYNDYLNIDADTVVLFDSSGIILASWAGTPFFSKAAPGDRVYDYLSLPHDIHNQINAPGIKTMEDDRFITAVYQTRGFPFRVAVSHEKKTLLHKWYMETRRVIAIVAATYVIAIITLVLGLNQRIKKRQAEVQLAQYRLGLEETVRQRTRQLDETNQHLMKKNQELTKAANEIQLLKGIIPICAHCKNVRDDKGYWQQVEKYIRSRSDAEFSHGICPDCAKKYYPDIEIYKE